MKTPINIFWFRRDLRLNDNHGLFEALSNGTTQAVFIFDKKILDELPKKDARVQFIIQELNKINAALKKQGASLKTYYGHVEECWKQILSDFEVEKVFTNHDYEPYAIQRDQQISELLSKNNIPFSTFKDQVIYEKFEVVKADGKPYTVYTPFKNKWLSQFDINTLVQYPSESKLDQMPSSDFNIQTLKDLGFEPSPIQVKDFNLKQAESYADLRDFPSKDATTHLSVHLRFGTVSIRQMIKDLWNRSQTLIEEFIWREFFMQILFHFPQVVTQSFKPPYDQIKWRNNEVEFKAWCEGKTGYPMVDAGMRELNQTGIMHNRVRMLTASFLCKHLMIDWRWGEAYFAEKLLDYDLSANNGNWQWAAGTGCDAAPYFRIFNPESQLKKFDKDLIYVRKWVTDFDEFTYPSPIVNHKMARERCLSTYKQALNKTE